MRSGALLAVLATFVLAACGGGGAGGGVDASELRRVVLQPRDLSGGFVRFDFGEIGRHDLQPGARFEADRFGRESGWKARYRRPGSPATQGPLIVVSTVDLFGSSDGAREDLDAYEAVLAERVRAAGGEPLDPPRVGEESRGATFVQGSGDFAVRYFVLAWRDRSLTASVEVSGFDGKLDLGDAVALARAQERRIAQALQD